jgi:acylphosphatase
MNKQNCTHYKITVTGKVQGVWFRKYTSEKAKSLGLKGWVKNLPDGNVYIEVESNDTEILDKFIRWLHQGSPMSKVKQVIVSEPDTCKNFTDFNIKK